VRGEVHTNCLENFWSSVERGLKGTYISVEPLYLLRCPDGRAFRYNHRKMDDGDRFNIVVRDIVGRRLTWDRLTGKN
jgi:ISXO2 transposase-like protein